MGTQLALRMAVLACIGVVAGCSGNKGSAPPVSDASSETKSTTSAPPHETVSSNAAQPSSHSNATTKTHRPGTPWWTLVVSRAHDAVGWTLAAVHDGSGWILGKATVTIQQIGNTRATESGQVADFRISVTSSDEHLPLKSQAFLVMNSVFPRSPLKRDSTRPWAR